MKVCVIDSHIVEHTFAQEIGLRELRCVVHEDAGEVSPRLDFDAAGPST